MNPANPRPGDTLTDDTGTRLTVLSVTRNAVRCRESYADGGEELVSMDRRAFRLRCEDVRARLALAGVG